MTLKEVIEYLSKEWDVIRRAPVTIILVGVICFIVAYQVARWRYEGILELNCERLAVKDDQLDEYRERLHFLPAHGSEYSRLSHSELQSKALKFVSDLRKWLAVRQSENSRRMSQQWLAMSQANDEAARKRLWNEYTADLIQSSTSMKNEYDAKFKVIAIVLRDELLTRIQHPGSSSSASHIYEYPTNPIGMGMVADDLERLARLLR